MLTAQTAQAADLDPNPFVSFKWSNDTYFHTDQNFSNGFDVRYGNNDLYIPFLDFLFFKKNDATRQQINLTLIQNLFTPKDLDTTGIIHNDRPYASYLMFAYGRDLLNSKKSMRMYQALYIGLLGEGSGGEFIQNGIHSLLKSSDDAKGWHNQITSDICLNYQFIHYYGLVRAKYFDAILRNELRIGVPHTYYQGGLNFRFGLKNDFFSTFEYERSDDFLVFLYSSLNLKLVAYDATYQGGVFSMSRHTIDNIKNVVGVGELGLAMQYKLLKLDLGAVYATKEIEIGARHRWGYLNIGLCF
jgi:lipid A 3-O-deacylase